MRNARAFDKMIVAEFGEASVSLQNGILRNALRRTEKQDQEIVYMATVRITGNRPNNIHKMEWLGTPAVNEDGSIERSIELPEEIYQAIERGIAGGNLEGFVSLSDGRKVEWFLDRA